METNHQRRVGVFTRTENGALQLRSTGNACLDLFAEIGSARNMVCEAPEALEGLFLEAYAHDAATAVAILFWSRSVRSGAGEREVFLHLLSILWELSPETVRDNLELLGELGCYRDYVRVAERIPALRGEVVRIFAEGVRANNYYACKWLPRRSALWAEVRAVLRMSNGDFRRAVAAASPTVEQLLAAGKPESVEYDKLPTQALNRYRALFARRDKERFFRTLAEKKLNTTAGFPHDLFRPWFSKPLQGITREEMNRIIDAQWRNLDNHLPADGGILPVLDTSGSMRWGHAVTPHQVAYPLALYCAERLSGPFRNRVCSFSSQARWLELPEVDSVTERMTALLEYGIVENTNVADVFRLLLATARRSGAGLETMPRCLLILSDMQFDAGAEYNETLMDRLRLDFKYAGYEFPAIVYWNLNATNTGAPDSVHDNVAMVSGFSPRILRAVFSGETASASRSLQLNPLEAMENALSPIRAALHLSRLNTLPRVLAYTITNRYRGTSYRLPARSSE
ncbi:MAG: DUF2828 family protein [Akkermansia sp.]|nr:DUF2828 family protein [Akkermansia sp.]